MKLMDEVAGIIAARHCKTNIVTASVDAINFHKKIKKGKGPAWCQAVFILPPVLHIPTGAKVPLHLLGKRKLLSCGWKSKKILAKCFPPTALLPISGWGWTSQLYIIEVS